MNSGVFLHYFTTCYRCQTSYSNLEMIFRGDGRHICKKCERQRLRECERGAPKLIKSCLVCGITEASKTIIPYAVYFPLCQQCLDMARFLMCDPKYQTLPHVLRYLSNVKAAEKGAIIYAKTPKLNCTVCGHEDKGKNFCYTANGPQCYPCRSRAL